MLTLFFISGVLPGGRLVLLIVIMQIDYGTTYYIKIRLPWGELVTFSCDRVTREADGTVRWQSDEGPGLEPSIDIPLSETPTHLSGWLGGTCDTVAVVGSVHDCPDP